VKAHQPNLVMRLHALSAIAEKLMLLHAAGFIHQTLQPDCVLWLQEKQQWVLAGPSAMALEGKETVLAYVLQ
jgi:hypothetical protein